MSEFDLTEDIPPEEPPAPSSPEDYEPDEPESRDTGTIYGIEGEPELTPHDKELLEGEDEE